MANLIGEEENFETLTARALREILEQLRVGQKACGERATPPEPSREKPGAVSARVGNRPIFTIELARPERVGSSLFIPSATAGVPQDWGVLTKVKDPLAKSMSLFFLVGVIDGSVGDHEFVSVCYRLLLERSADRHGSADYFNGLRNRQITRLDVIKYILASEEARTSNRQMALMPDPKRWLSHFVADYVDGSALPLFELRY